MRLVQPRISACAGESFAIAINSAFSLSSRPAATNPFHDQYGPRRTGRFGRQQLGRAVGEGQVDGKTADVNQISVNPAVAQELGRVGIGDEPPGGGRPVPEGINRERVRDDRVVRAKGMALAAQLIEHPGVNGVGGNQRDGLLLRDQPAEQAPMAAEGAEHPRRARRFVEPAEDAAPCLGGVVDQLEIAAAGNAIQARGAQREEIDELGGDAGLLIERGLERARRAVVAFAVAGG
jgi:hypothetical protein